MPIPWAIVGPTASGKSAVALALAEAVGGEIVSCDSVQVYRGFEIGCAKPSAAERTRVQHHLLDVVEWHEAFDAQRYRALSTVALTDIGARAKQAIVCGGTGLYLRALRYGLVDIPSSSPEMRAELLAGEEAEPGSTFARLKAVDPESALRIDPKNLVHVVRALEIYRLTGTPASQVRAQHGFAGEQVPMQVMALGLSLGLLKERIAKRIDAMLAAGFMDEVIGLLARGVAPNARPLTSVGYREVVAVVRGEAQPKDLRERILASTYAYARRQLTWLRRERAIEWCDATDAGELIKVLKGRMTRAMEP